MAGFRRCENCNWYNYNKLDDEDVECILFGYDTCEDKKGNQGCYRSDKTLKKLADRILKAIRESQDKEN